MKTESMLLWGVMGQILALNGYLRKGVSSLLSILKMFLYNLTNRSLKLPQVSRYALLFLLVTALMKGLTWSLIVPPFQTPDEPQHFLYGSEIIRQDSLSIQPEPTVPADAWLLGDLVPIMQGNIGKPLDFSDTAQLNQKLRAIDQPMQRYILDKLHLIVVPDFVLFHPPAYYTVLAKTQEILRGESVRWRLLVGRWISVLLGVATVGFAYAIGREIWPQRQSLALLLGTLVAFQPMNAFTLASVSNDAALIALFTLLLWQGLRVSRIGMNPLRGATMGAVLAIGLLVKMSFASAIPLVGVLFIWRGWREIKTLSRRKMRPLFLIRSLSGWMIVLILPIVFSGSWYSNKLGRGSDHLVQTTLSRKPEGSAVSRQKLHERAPNSGGWESQLRKTVTDSSLIAIGVKYARVITSYWGNFGWVNVRVPTAIWITLLLVTIYTITMGTRRLLLSNQKEIVDTDGTILTTRRQRRALWWMAGGSIVLITFYVVVDWRVNLMFGLRGGYYLPAVSGQMAWLIMCLIHNRRNIPDNLLVIGLGAGMVVYNFYCLFAVVGKQYYGSSYPQNVLQMTGYLQPINSGILNLICLGMFLSTFLLLLRMYGLIQMEMSIGKDK